MGSKVYVLEVNCASGRVDSLSIGHRPDLHLQLSHSHILTEQDSQACSLRLIIVCSRLFAACDPLAVQRAPIDLLQFA